MENDYEEKVGPAYDAIRSNLLMHYQDRIWEMMKHVSTVELASLAGCYYLWKSGNVILVAFLLVVASGFIYFLRKAVIRYTHLALSATLALNDGRNIYFDYSPAKGGEGSRVRGYVIARRIASFAIAVNFIVFCISLLIIALRLACYFYVFSISCPYFC